MSTKFTVLILFLSLRSANSVKHVKLGGEVVINTSSTANSITSITWKHGGDIAVEWFGQKIDSYRQFKGHSALNTSTGALTLSGLTRTHSGSYTAEINNRVADTTEIQVISGVPKPTVSEQCDTKWTRCLLTCEGNTTDAEPVTYSWWTSDMIQIYKGREFNITEENQEYGFYCEMENPVSSESSDTFTNLLKQRNQTYVIIPLACLILFLIGFFIWCKLKSRKEMKSEDVEGSVEEGQKRLGASTNREDRNPNPDQEVVGASTNGDAGTSLPVQVTSGQTPTSSVVPLTSSQTEIIDESSNQDKETPTEPSDEPEKSAEESNGEETTKPLLEEQN